MSQPKPLITLRLIHHVHGADFRYGPLANLLQFRKEAVFGDSAGARNYNRNDAVLFISKTGKRGFIVPGTALRLSNEELLNGKFVYYAFHCPRGFSWWMLGNYMDEIGVSLIGVKRFEQLMEQVAHGVMKALDPLGKPEETVATAKKRQHAHERMMKAVKTDPNFTATETTETRH